MADDTLDFEVRRFLMSEISDRYKTLRGQMYKAFGQSGYALAYSNIANAFMGGDFTGERELINEHKERFANKKYSDYNYFDLDSLYPFLLYLDTLSRKIDEYAWHNKGVINKRIFEGALQDTIIEFNNTKNTKASGYYKGYVTLAKKEGTDLLNPIKTNNDKVDRSKEFTYYKYINEYFKNKYERGVHPVQQFVEKKYSAQQSSSSQLSIDNVRKTETNKETESPIEESAEDREYEDFEIVRYKYKGKNCILVIESEEKFYTAEGFPVYRIRAVGRYGRYFKTTDINDNIYYGPLYNDEFEEVLGAEESGEEFFPTAELIRLVGEKKESHKASTTKKPNKYADNYTMFNDEGKDIDD